MQQQRTDDTLVDARRWTDGHEHGYLWDGGLLQHRKDDVLGQPQERIILPTSRRKAAMEPAPSSLLGGHLGNKKTLARLKRHFVWPGMASEVKKLCSTCPRCQLMAEGSTSLTIACHNRTNSKIGI